MSDEWSEWLLHRRHADDPAYLSTLRAETERYADRVLDAGRLVPGMRLLDVGSGEGLLAFRAIERIGPGLQVVLSDISMPMLEYAQARARERGVANQCTFIHCTADRLQGIASGSVDVVATRAVLAYVADKASALTEFCRVLKPQGRISLAEPIFQDDALLTSSLRAMLEAKTPATEGILPLLHRWKAAQFPDTAHKMAASPITNYSERDLFELAHRTGFTDIHLELHIDMYPCPVSSWDVVLGSSPHPWSPTLSRVLEEQFTPEERRRFEQALRPMVESGKALSVTRMAYLSARKPV
jgi:arsenite methyltransferase